jgi:hypothetical protein
MKKINWIAPSLAIVIALCSAFATRPHFDCSQMLQYYYSGGVYFEAGIEGDTYVCSLGTGTCTYYTENGQNFYECQSGTYCTSNCLVGIKEKEAAEKTK